MSILSQIGVVILIVFIILVLIRSNKTLEDVSREGEHFVDEWALKEQKKEERKELKEEKKRGLGSEKRQKLVLKQQPEEENEKNEIWDETMEKENYDDRASSDSKDDNIIPMVKNKNTGIVLVEMDEQHYPLHRYIVNQIPYSIGRSQKNQLVLDDLCVARMHCRIVEKNGMYVLKDSGTANKLFVNGEIVSQIILSDKMRLYIGNVEFLIEMGMQRSDKMREYQNVGAGYYG